MKCFSNQMKTLYVFITEHSWQPAQHSNRTTSDDRHEGGPGAVSLPLPRSDDLGRPDEAPEDGALYVAAWRGGHGQGTQLCPHFDLNSLIL